MATTRRPAGPLVVAVAALLFAGLFVARNLVAFDGDPTVFITIGEDAGAAREHAESLLGEGIHLVPEVGHDGRFFFAQANDPYLNDPDTLTRVLDRPIYRTQRMLFPLIAGGFGLLPPWGVVWGIVGLSVATFGFGSYATALVARGMGGSAWWGLAFGLNLGVLSELLVGGSGHFAAALVLGAVALLQRGKVGWAVGLVTAAVLTREVMLVSAVGLAVWLWRQSERRAAGLVLIVPGITAGLWALFVRIRLGWNGVVGEVEEIGWPLEGFLEAAQLWNRDGRSLAAGIVTIVILVLFTVRFLRSDWLVGYAAVGFVPLTMLLTRQVLANYYNISRAIVLLTTAYVLMAFAARGEPNEGLSMRAAP